MSALPPKIALPVHLIEVKKRKACSVCKQEINPNGTTLSKAFRVHVMEKHRPQVKNGGKRWTA